MLPAVAAAVAAPAGEGTILGGLLVVGKGDSGIKAMHVEKSFGDYGEILEVLEEAKKVAAK